MLETVVLPSAIPVIPTVPSGGSATDISGPSSAAIPEIPDVVFLHRGEFPFCLARRYNIDPNQILWLNGFFPGQIYFAGQPVHLPRNPHPFPGDRRLRPHPNSHIVQPGETIYRIACYYGDIDPAYLAELNGLSPDSWLYPGQVLILP